MDRSREFHSLLVMARNNIFAAEPESLMEYSYGHIHAQFKSLCVTIRGELMEARRILLALSSTHSPPITLRSEGSLQSTGYLSPSFIMSQPPPSLDAIKALATNVTREIQNLKSFQCSIATMNNIPVHYAEHTLFVCKFLESNCRSLADQFERILHQERKLTSSHFDASYQHVGTKPSEHLPFMAQQMTLPPMDKTLTHHSEDTVQTYVPGQTANFPGSSSTLRGRYHSHAEIPSAHEEQPAFQPSFYIRPSYS